VAPPLTIALLAMNIADRTIELATKEWFADATAAPLLCHERARQHMPGRTIAWRENHSSSRRCG
jgi:hypothetical protein